MIEAGRGRPELIRKGRIGRVGAGRSIFVGGTEKERASIEIGLIFKTLGCYRVRCKKIEPGRDGLQGNRSEEVESGWSEEGVGRAASMSIAKGRIVTYWDGAGQGFAGRGGWSEYRSMMMIDDDDDSFFIRGYGALPSGGDRGA